MELQVEWDNLIILENGTDMNLIYTTDLSKLPTVAGVYVFGRQWASGFEALYVGKATHIRNRVKGQFNNLHLMQHLKKSKIGKRILLTGRIVTRPGQKIEKCLPLVESQAFLGALLRGKVSGT